IHLSPYDSDSIFNSYVTLEVGTLPAVVSGTEFLVSDRDNHSLRRGQHVVVLPSGRLPDYFRASAGAQVTIHSGTVGHHFEADGTTVELHSGSIGDEFAGFVRT